MLWIIIAFCTDFFNVNPKKISCGANPQNKKSAPAGLPDRNASGLNEKRFHL
jgi:hypothetical protein